MSNLEELDKLTRGVEKISLNTKRKWKSGDPTIVKTIDENGMIKDVEINNKKKKNEIPTKVYVTDENNKRRLVLRPPKFNLNLNSFGKKKKSKRIFGLTPDQFTIKTSTIPNAGNGAFANIFLPKGSVLGNYKGKRLSSQQYNRLRDQSYVWELSSRHGPIYIDGKNPKLSNWLRFLNDSRDRRVNVEPYQSHGNIFYRAIKNIKPGEEMFISYGDEYW